MAPPAAAVLDGSEGEDGTAVDREAEGAGLLGDGRPVAEPEPEEDDHVRVLVAAAADVGGHIGRAPRQRAGVLQSQQPGPGELAPGPRWRARRRVGGAT